jgi:putative tricarboxylic transport membrane protein
MLLFGVLGYIMRKLEYEMAPLVLALILGPMFENALRQSLIIFNGNPLVFFTRPISAAFLIGALLLLISNLLPWMRSRKKFLAETD